MGKELRTQAHGSELRAQDRSLGPGTGHGLMSYSSDINKQDIGKFSFVALHKPPLQPPARARGPVLFCFLTAMRPRTGTIIHARYGRAVGTSACFLCSVAIATSMQQWWNICTCNTASVNCGTKHTECARATHSFTQLIITLFHPHPTFPLASLAYLLPTASASGDSGRGRGRAAGGCSLLPC